MMLLMSWLDFGIDQRRGAYQCCIIVDNV